MELLLSLLDAELLKEIFSAEMARLTVAFVLAERLHARSMRKNLTEQFNLLRGTIDHVAEIMAKRMDGLEGRVERLEGE
jgi:hypothetical protein